MKKKKLMEEVREIDESNSRYMYNLGRLPRIAAITLQRAIRRFFFYCKIQRITKVYHYLAKKKEEDTYRIIRSLLPILYDKMIIKNLKWEKIKGKKLFLIKRKLAILKIKNLFKKEKLSWKIIKIRIRKFKRNIKPPNAKPLIRRNTLMIEEKQIEIKRDMKKEEPTNVEKKKLQIKEIKADSLPKIIETTVETIKFDQNSSEVQNSEGIRSSSSQVSIETTTTEKEALAHAEMLKKFEEDRQNKIALGKISYNVREEPRILPYLKNVPLVPGTIPKPIIEKKIIKEKDSEKINEKKAAKKKSFNDSYMRETISFQFSRFDAPEPVFENHTQTAYTKVRNNSTLMVPTSAFMQKISGNPSARSHSTETKTGEKLEIIKKKFASIGFLNVPPPPSQPKKIPILLIKTTKNEVKSEEAQPQSAKVNSFSLSFNDALPEYSGFLTHYQKTPKRPKLDPILLKAKKILPQEITDFS